MLLILQIYLPPSTPGSKENPAPVSRAFPHKSHRRTSGAKLGQSWAIAVNAEENKSFITSNCASEAYGGEIQEVGPPVLRPENYFRVSESGRCSGEPGWKVRIDCNNEGDESNGGAEL